MSSFHVVSSVNGSLVFAYDVGFRKNVRTKQLVLLAMETFCGKLTNILCIYCRVQERHLSFHVSCGLRVLCVMWCTDTCFRLRFGGPQHMLFGHNVFGRPPFRSPLRLSAHASYAVKPAVSESQPTRPSSVSDTFLYKVLYRTYWCHDPNKVITHHIATEQETILRLSFVGLSFFGLLPYFLFRSTIPSRIYSFQSMYRVLFITLGVKRFPIMRDCLHSHKDFSNERQVPLWTGFYCVTSGSYKISIEYDLWDLRFPRRWKCVFWSSGFWRRVVL
jgi:hypothetical protein